MSRGQNDQHKRPTQNLDRHLVDTDQTDIAVIGKVCAKPGRRKDVGGKAFRQSILHEIERVVKTRHRKDGQVIEALGWRCRR